MAIGLASAIFLDKDGTLIHDVPYNVDPLHISLCPSVGTSLKRLQDKGYKLIVISNQSGVAKGKFAAAALQGVSNRIQQLLDKDGVVFDAFYYCPHDTIDDCLCRKPLPGLIQQAAVHHGIDLHSSWMAGDILNDVEAGRKAGCRTILIDNGNETEWLPGQFREPDYTVANFQQAAQQVIQRNEREGKSNETRTLVHN